MAAYAALVSLMNNVEQIKSHPHLSTSLDYQHIDPLLQKAGLLLHFVENNNYGGHTKESDDLEREIASAAHAVEDLIESHIVHQIHAGTSEASLKCSLDLQQKTQEMDAVIKKTNEFQESCRSREEQPTPTPTPVSVMEIEESAMVGVDDVLEQLLHELTNVYESSRRIISIVGMGGTGKTTLAKNIFENQLIKEHFDFLAWATISQQHNAQETLSRLLHGKSSNKSEDLGLELHKKLSGRRYLIILDDIWSVKPWDEVRRFFPDNKNGSRIVLTTRESNVASDCGSSLFKLNLLDKANSWKLFCQKAFKVNEDCPHELREMGEEIVRLCKGLALSIVVMGGLVSKSPRTVEYWKGVVRDIKSISDSKEKQESLDVLSLSYSHLPAHLKPCFLYMGVYKEDSQIRVSNIVKLWAAEGFIKSNGSQIIEETGEGYIKDLIDRNLIYVSRWRKNGKIGCCGIHDLLRDLCIKVGEQQQFFCFSDGDGYGSHVRGIERRIISRSYNSKLIEGGFPLARSITTEYIHPLPVKQELLRVLSCENKVDSPAEELYENVNLRYLAYDKPYDSGETYELPNSVSLMWNLQTLIISGVYSSVVAPREIWKMRQLRHLECYEIYIPPYDGVDEELILEKMQTLKTAIKLRLCADVCKRIPNIKKLYLEYNERLQGYDDSLIENLCNLGLLHKLESLYLDVKWPYQLIEKLAFPSSLKKLCFEFCHLKWEDMRVIGSLPQLQVLMLGFCTVDGKEWSPVNGQFRCLKYLKISECGLSYWNAESSHFPVLEKLLLEHMFNLEEIPSEIGEIPTLELIRVKNCSDSATISAVKIKEDQVEQGIDGPQVQVIIFESQLASLKEAVAIDSVELEIY